MVAVSRLSPRKPALRTITMGKMSQPHEEFRRRQKRVTLRGLSHLDLELAYTDVGDGQPVVLLHGIPTWSFLYHDVIPRLEPHCRVLAPDFLGHGYSDRRDRFDRSLVAQTRAILAFLDVLGIERATFVGHDTGGGVALILAIDHPERVERLVLSNAVAYDSWPVGDMIALGDPTWRAKDPHEVAEFVAAGFADGIHRKERLTAAFREGIVAPYCDEEGKISLIRNASALNTNHTMALVDRHREIRAPTLLLWGVHDPWQWIVDGERLAQEIPGARLVRVEASHWIPQDAPEQFASGITAFLAEPSASADATT
jgi:pimeloyl-ACP methyl ester carboxylesterase